MSNLTNARPDVTRPKATESCSSQPRKIISRKTARQRAGWSDTTLSRREKSDPRIPERINVGPGEHGPFGYDEVEWNAYLASLPRNRPVPTPEKAANGAALSKIGLAARLAKARNTVSGVGASEDTAAESPSPSPRSRLRTPAMPF